ncbi:hypothetical protein NL676_038132 [Syzygium grande]|nr:hypothetical protein NL676_038132 [Syzygium grande]
MEYGGGAPVPSMSQWLHAALSEIEAKTLYMLNLIQCDWETYHERVERHYRRRPELAEMLKSWHRSYCYLAQKHDELWSLYVQITTVQADSYPEDPDLTVETGKLDHLNCATDGSPGTAFLEFAGETKEREEIENGGEASGSSTLQWLHATLADIDTKMQRMLNLIEGNGGTIPERAERYYRRRSEFAEMLKDWHRSYCYSAQKHYELWSRYVQVTTVQAKCYPEDPDHTVETGELDHLNCATDGSPGTACHEVTGETKEREETENRGEAFGSSMSQDLHATLSDCDAKMQHMLNLIEGGTETFAERAERYYWRRPGLAELLKDWRRNYCYLAQKHDELWSRYVQVMPSSSSNGAQHADSYPEDPDLTVETGELNHLNCVTNRSPNTACHEVAGEAKGGKRPMRKAK